MGNIDYKQKYQELKAKFISSVDAAYRLGIEEGARQVQIEQAAQAERQQQEMEAAQMNAMNGGAESQDQQQQQPSDGNDQGATMPAGPGQGIQQADSQDPAGSELDQHIAKLEGMLGKSELELNAEDLKKAVGELKQLRDLKKSQQAISGIAKALHKPVFKIGQQASHNMSTNAKQAVTMQHKIVNDIMKNWEEEEKKATKDIKQVLNLEGLSKKE